eukprot:GGOE01036849.1.p1 GENE.GGOE01036849.1~~GGOE01036849.1.p1  ORF type:complete len:421 (-),score=97.91 GGOE01036849.1:111-1373(-)
MSSERRRIVLPLENGRFTATVLTMSNAHNTTQKCACFLIPQGKEHEWMFATEEGQWQLYVSASATRLIIVALNRGHHFGNLQSVQQELGPHVLKLAGRDVQAKVPFMTVASGIGKRHSVAQYESQLTGSIVVEDVEESGSVYRRLVFGRNPNMIQTEAVVVQGQCQPTSLTGEYHQMMVAALACLTPQALLRKESCEGSNMVVGLGGGMFPLFLHNCLGLPVSVVELDEVVAEVAKQHFNFLEGPGLQLTVADGLEEVRKAPTDSLQLLVIDADCGDMTIGMSAPPECFTTADFLEDAKRALGAEGLLLMNVAARAEGKMQELVDRLLGTFEVVFEFPIEDQINRVIAALPKAVEHDIAKMVLAPLAGLDIATLVSSMTCLKPGATPGATYTRHPVFPPRPSTAGAAPKAKRSRKAKGKH